MKTSIAELAKVQCVEHVACRRGWRTPCWKTLPSHVVEDFEGKKYQPRVDVNLTINGLYWEVDAKWEYIRDRKMAEVALIELVQKIHAQETF